MPAAKKLIEVALPLDAINVASAREKSIRHGHPSTLHLWWSRKPLATTRAVIFASLVDDPDDPDANPAFVTACKQLPGDGPNVAAKGDSPRMRLFDFIERLVTWEATTDEKIMGQARDLICIATNGNPPPLLDPFAGGGSIPLEAQRLGLEAHASDLNPVAVMINKAMIEIPPRFADMPPVNPDAPLYPHPPAPSPIKREGGRDTTWKGAAGLAADVRYYGEWMRERAFEKIGHLYPQHKGETVIAWLWARTVISPNPAVNAPVPLASSFVLSKKKGRECWAKPIVEGKTVRFEVTNGVPPKDADGSMGRKFGGGRCVVSGEPMSWDYVRAEGKAGRMGTMLMAIVTKGRHGRNYYSSDSRHLEVAVVDRPDWTPNFDLPDNPRDFKTPLYGMNTFADLFTPRQLVALTTFSDLVHEARELATADALRAGLADDGVPLRDGGTGARAYGEAVSVYLALLVSQVANHLSSICSWNTPNEQMRNVFSRQAIAMTWDYAESNVFCQSSGSYHNLFDRMLKGFGALGFGKGSVAIQEDAMRLYRDATFTVSTDPPYYDNIGYADLSDFFYVWLRRSLRAIYPDVFSTMLVPKTTELIASTYRHSNKHEAKEFFESGMLEAFANIRGFVKDDLPLTVYYAFKQQDAGFLQGESSAGVASTGWETMLTSLLQSGFSVLGTWPMRTERGGRMNAVETNSLASSIVLVCRPRPEDAPSTSRRRFLDALRAELPAAIADMKTGNIGPVDLPQASIGPGMAIYSRYSAVLEADGSPLTVRAALSEINKALDAALEEPISRLGTPRRNSPSTGSRSMVTKPATSAVPMCWRGPKIPAWRAWRWRVWRKAQGGKVRLVNWREYDPGAYDPQQDKRPTVWEGTHHLVERLNSFMAKQARRRCSTDCRGISPTIGARFGVSICIISASAKAGRRMRWITMRWAALGQRSTGWRRVSVGGRHRPNCLMIERTYRVGPGNS